MSSRPELLFDQLRRDAADPGSSRDFGKDIIPYLVQHGKAVAHRFTDPASSARTRSEAYWRDVGTIDAYWEANVDLTETLPALDLYDQTGRSGPMPRSPRPPSSCTTARAGAARPWPRWSRAAASCRAPRAHSLLFTGVKVNSFSLLQQAVVLPYVHIGRNVG
jgi:glucose-1-phosphate adenylyltransferase